MKIWASVIVTIVAGTLPLLIVIAWILHVPVVGSIPQSADGMTIYLFIIVLLGVLLANIVNSRPQIALLGVGVPDP